MGSAASAASLLHFCINAFTPTNAAHPLHPTWQRVWDLRILRAPVKPRHVRRHHLLHQGRCWMPREGVERVVVRLLLCCDEVLLYRGKCDDTQQCFNPTPTPNPTPNPFYHRQPGTVRSIDVKRFDGQNWEAAYAATGIAACSKG